MTRQEIADDIINTIGEDSLGIFIMEKLLKLRITNELQEYKSKILARCIETQDLVELHTAVINSKIYKNNRRT